MARVRIPDELRDEVKEYVRDSGNYDTMSEFAKDSIRRLLDEKKKTDSREELKKEIVQDLKEELKE